MSKISSFKSMENKHDVCRGYNCIKKFSEVLREYAMKIINFKKKKMKLLKNSSRNHMKMQKSVIFVKKKLKINIGKIKNVAKSEIIFIVQKNIEVLLIPYVF